jgi:hypothetical protein
MLPTPSLDYPSNCRHPCIPPVEGSASSRRPTNSRMGDAVGRAGKSTSQANDLMPHITRVLLILALIAAALAGIRR